MRKTKIVCTIGPASESYETIGQLIDAGMNVARLNFSHGDFKEHGERIKNIRKAAKDKGKAVAILLDLKGPEIRTGNFEDYEVEINRGDSVTVAMGEVMGTKEKFSVTYTDLYKDVSKGSTILIDDGLIELEVTHINEEDKEIYTVALNTGFVSDHKGVNIPNVQVNLPGITQKDVEDIKFGIEHDVEFIAGSFIRTAEDILEIRELLENDQAEHIQLISKIENQEGVDNIESILEVCDGVMVARGDLGVEIPAEDVPLVQKELIKYCNIIGKPVITATQMLDSMQRNPRPTRAEASDVANAIFDGTDAIMLSGETAAGDFPVESVEMMHDIASKTETALDNQHILKTRSRSVDMNITDAISQSVTHTAMNLSASAIITPTESGYTARMISKYRPKMPIVAVTSSETVQRQLSLVWGVHATLGHATNTTDEMLEVAVEKGLHTGLVKHGSQVVITAGVPVGESGTTNLMKVHVIGDIIAKGQGIGRRTAFGKVTVATSAEEALQKIKPGDILVAPATDRDMMPAIEQASGIVTEQGGLTSHAAVVGLSLGIPVIVGVEKATEVITDDEEVTLDGVKGDIYKGHTSVL